MTPKRKMCVVYVARYSHLLLFAPNVNVLYYAPENDINGYRLHPSPTLLKCSIKPPFCLPVLALRNVWSVNLSLISKEISRQHLQILVLIFLVSVSLDYKHISLLKMIETDISFTLHRLYWDAAPNHPSAFLYLQMGMFEVQICLQSARKLADSIFKRSPHRCCGVHA